MTVIIGSLFLPYTVHFQIDKDQYDFLQSENSSKIENLRISSVSNVGSDDGSKSILSETISSTPSSQLSHQPQSIIPTLPRQKDSPVFDHSKHAPAGDRSGPSRTETPEGFFYNKRPGAISRNNTNSSYPAYPAPATRLPQDQHYIQPKSRINNLKIESSITEPKKLNDPYGTPALKISRSSSSLANPNPAALARPPNYGSGSSFTKSYSPSGSVKSTMQMPIHSRSKQKFGFTLHGNSSTNSLVSEEYDNNNNNNNNAMIPSSLEDEDEDGLSGFEKNYKNSVSYNKGLAPFGGFSKPGIEKNLWEDSNIFDTAEWTVVPSDDGNGSLTKAVDVSMKNHVINKVKWVGVIAMPSDTISDHVKHDIASKLASDFDCEAVFPNDITFEGHYKSFCKQILWPTLHYQIPDDPKSKAFEDHSWGHYVLMNQLVADKLVEAFISSNGEHNFEDSENVIWIHDYHLLLVPKMIREKLPNVKIGLFLHVSFPSSEVFRCLAQRTEILEGMLAANCISFQTNEYVRHFLQTCTRLLPAEVKDKKLLFDGKLIAVNTIPVGIDSPALAKIVHSEQVQEWRRLIRERWGNEKLIISRDKLDKLRGVKQKLLAYEKFLKSNPEYIDNSILIQICIGSSPDSLYESEIMKIVSRINSLPDNISITQPVVFLQRDIEFDQYLALQCEAEVFVVSSMREGLNLTCHEFITATEEKKSPLVLSEFTGSSSLLSCNGEGALLINPWDLKKFAEAIHDALTMDKKEKAIRWDNCHNFVLTQDSKHWIRECLESINSAWAFNNPS
ncbi:uncharacterized protein LODBEIA_P38410 [Lodderomyces beijingensis]|uniref:Uncharacterized protein n=1 Tax=Lodderomyces beijingensis TaxID=1775926 RepID=A0ABP0ZTM5_9ASCO